MIQEVKMNVVLLHSPNDVMDHFSAKAARFCTSSDTIQEIMSSRENDEKILERVVDYGHLSVLRFDWWIFGIESVSRTLTHQLVRKTTGVCFAQESMRYTSQNGVYRIIIPESLKDKSVKINIPNNPNCNNSDHMTLITLEDLADMAHQFYEGIQKQDVPKEDARFGLLEASNTKIMFGINSQALLDFFAERTCSCAQWEIRDCAKEMLRLCKEIDPVVFKNAGPKCIKSGYCPEAKTKWCGFRPHKSETEEPITKKEILARIIKLTNLLKEMV
jgi:thymidylate synthase (FAD)